MIKKDCKLKNSAGSWLVGQFWKQSFIFWKQIENWSLSSTVGYEKTENVFAIVFFNLT